MFSTTNEKRKLTREFWALSFEVVPLIRRPASDDKLEYG
jgi:hypothetical protein